VRLVYVYMYVYIYIYIYLKKKVDEACDDDLLSISHFHLLSHVSTLSYELFLDRTRPRSSQGINMICELFCKCLFERSFSSVLVLAISAWRSTSSSLSSCCRNLPSDDPGAIEEPLGVLWTRTRCDVVLWSRSSMTSNDSTSIVYHIITAIALCSTLGEHRHSRARVGSKGGNGAKARISLAGLFASPMCTRVCVRVRVCMQQVHTRTLYV
jgi:hypothetical protein